MAESRPDRHDRDKLVRWHRDLLAATAGGFPVHAVFLVSDDDRAAHHIFREYRSSFEGLAAGFEYLVIFGQHGVSRAERSLLAEFGLPTSSIPTLVLVVPGDRNTAYSLSLPTGNTADLTSGRGSQPWQEALTMVERANAVEAKALALSTIPEARPCRTGTGSLTVLVGKALDHLDER
jgi:hypothetical protein